MKSSVPTLRVFESEKPTVESLAPWVRRTERHGKEIATRCTNEARQRGFITKAEESAYRVFLSHRASSIAVLVEKALSLPENALVVAPAVKQDRDTTQPDLFAVSGQALAEDDSIGGQNNEA